MAHKSVLEIAVQDVLKKEKETGLSRDTERYVKAFISKLNNLDFTICNTYGNKKLAIFQYMPTITYRTIESAEEILKRDNFISKEDKLEAGVDFGCGVLLIHLNAETEQPGTSLSERESNDGTT